MPSSARSIAPTAHPLGGLRDRCAATARRAGARPRRRPRGRAARRSAPRRGPRRARPGRRRTRSRPAGTSVNGPGSVTLIGAVGVRRAGTRRRAPRPGRVRRTGPDDRAAPAPCARPGADRGRLLAVDALERGRERARSSSRGGPRRRVTMSIPARSMSRSASSVASSWASSRRLAGDRHARARARAARARESSSWSISQPGCGWLPTTVVGRSAVAGIAPPYPPRRAGQRPARLTRATISATTASGVRVVLSSTTASAAGASGECARSRSPRSRARCASSTFRGVGSELACRDARRAPPRSRSGRP